MRRAIVRACLVKANLDRCRSVDIDRVLLPMIRDLGRAVGSFADPGHQGG